MSNRKNRRNRSNSSKNSNGSRVTRAQATTCFCLAKPAFETPNGHGRLVVSSSACTNLEHMAAPGRFVFRPADFASV